MAKIAINTFETALTPGVAGAGVLIFSPVGTPYSLSECFAVWANNGNTLVYAKGVTGLGVTEVNLGGGNYQWTFQADTSGLSASDNFTFLLDLASVGPQQVNVVNQPEPLPPSDGTEMEPTAVMAQDLLADAFDERSGTRLQVGTPDIKKGPDLGLMLSDAPAQILSTSASTARPVIPTIDTYGYNSIVVQLAGTWSGSVTFQVSNDGSNWFSTIYMPLNTASYTTLTPVASTGLYSIPVTGRFFRAIFSQYFSGLITAVTILRTAAAVPASNANPTIAGSPVSLAGGANISLPVSGAASAGIGGAAYYPVQAGGADSAGTIRKFLTDTSGRLNTTTMGTMGLPLSPQAASSLSVLDESIVDGHNRNELLWRIMLEQQITNHLLRQMCDGSAMEDPATLRNDPSQIM